MLGPWKEIKPAHLSRGVTLHISFKIHFHWMYWKEGGGIGMNERQRAVPDRTKVSLDKSRPFSTSFSLPTFVFPFYLDGKLFQAGTASYRVFAHGFTKQAIPSQLGPRGAADHLAMCIALHPATCHIEDKLLEDARVAQKLERWGKQWVRCLST